MAEYNDGGFERVRGPREVANEIWNAQHGVMISYGVSALARRAYSRASRRFNDDGGYDYIVTTDGSSRTLVNARKESVGLNAGALGVIHALNGWDRRSREVVTVPFAGKKMRKWMGTFRFNGLESRERSYLAAPFSTVMSALQLPDAPDFFADKLDIICQQASAESLAVETTLSFDEGSKVYGIEADGLIVPGKPFGFEKGAGVIAFDQDEATVSLQGLFDYLTQQIRE